MDNFIFSKYLEDNGVKLLGMPVEDADKIISEVLNREAYIKLDQKDVEDVCRDSTVISMVTGVSCNDNRLVEAFAEAKRELNVPSKSTCKAMVIIMMSKKSPMAMYEIDQLSREIDFLSADAVIWGVSFDESLNENLKIILMVSSNNS